MMNRRSLLTAGGAALVLGGGWLALNAGRSPADSPLLVGMAEAQEAADPSGIEEMVLGNPDAAVEVIEYASFTCPHCASFHANQFEELKANYIDNGKIRFVYREVYFDRPGLWASMIARCGGDTNRFFAIADIIYQKQREWTASGDPATIASELATIGKVAGLDQAAIDECMSDGAFAQSLVAWFEANSKADGIRSTPSFIIDGESYSNMAYAEFAAVLDEKLGS